MNLRKRIISIINEEIKLNTKLRRRLTDLDYEFVDNVKRIYTPHVICQYRNSYELFSVISEDSIDSMYWNYFSDISDDEWVIIFKDMKKYLINKYLDKIEEYYHINCGD